jgi:hypothetical protein
MLLQHEGGGHGTCAGSRRASIASYRTSSSSRRSRADVGGEPNDHFHELGKWGCGAEEDDDICRWQGTESDYYHLEQWRTVVRDDNDDHD